MMIIVIIKMIILYEIVFLYRYTDVCIIYVVVFERKKHYLSINAYYQVVVTHDNDIYL